jgi:hypothetical protein
LTEPKASTASAEPQVTCDHCGSPATALKWVKCKLICQNCRQIVKSCADL